MGPFSQPFDYATAFMLAPNRGAERRPALPPRPAGGLTRSMRVTKFEHATLTVVEAGRTLVIDPGSYTAPLGVLEEVVAIVVTHEHPDHWTPDHLDRILHTFPGIPIFGPEGLAKAAAGYDITVVKPGDSVTLDPFTLQFFGGEHAVIHSSIPTIDNVGVLVDDEFYYAGDSFVVPDVAVGTLAAPAGAPWMKIAESMDYVVELAPQRAFGTHEMVLSQAGKDLSHARLEWATQQGGGQYHPLKPGETLDV